ncbi:GNAT family N-acetyltransferase [Micromonospora sp. NPDC050276]|uniref:GNAT family N-acetyltransferase n=1 Tax=Micromonospora sp. NPDC050276 TaxID=3364278 RepID=UPI0037A4A46E
MSSDQVTTEFSIKPTLTGERVYEKVGFVVEGVLRQTLRDGDDWIDATVMSTLAPEWAAHRGHPER